MSKHYIYSTYILQEVFDDDGNTIVSTVTPGWAAECGKCDWVYLDGTWDSVTNELDFHCWTTHEPYTCKTL